MSVPPPREIDSLTALEALLRAGSSLHGLRLQDLDLRPVEASLRSRTDLRGLVVLGGAVSDDLAGHLRRHGAIVFPEDPDAPVDVYRPRLYSPDELYAGLDRGYEHTPDARAYAWTLEESSRHDAYATVLRAIHDDSVTDALHEVLVGRRTVGVMGGHALARGERAYADAAGLGHRLAEAGFVVLTGGGPGAMEAANLGALARDRADLDAAISALATVPSFRPSVRDWAEVALTARAGLVPELPQVRSIGIPTWFYGHEPPNVFCDAIAKYFSNALREEGLLARSTEGVVVLPGAAGTVQEIFQAITPLYYAADGAALPRLVLVGERHWTQTVPVWPAVESLGAGRALGDRVALVDDPSAAADLVLAD